VVKRRRFTGRRKARSPRKDWVYRDDGLSTDASTADDLGTYSPNAVVISSPAITGLVLYDSHNYMRASTHGGGGGLGFLQAAARATGRRASAYAVRGQILVDTASWTVNDELILGLRIGVFKQDPGNGQLLIEPLYSMFQNAGDISISTYANRQRQNMWERRYIRNQPGGETLPATFTIPVHLRCNVRLADDDCLALFMELDQGSVNARITCWLSSLIADEG